MEHILLCIAGIALLLLLLAAIVTGVIITRRDNVKKPFDYLLVLGTTVNGTVPSIMLRERINAAYAYLTENPSVICIATGGGGRRGDIPEARCIAQELINLGINPQRIWLEEAAASTRENLRLSTALIKENAGKSPDQIGILTSDFHTFRVRMTARRMGLPATVIGCKSAHTIFYYPAFLREIMAVWYYYLFKKA